MSLPKNYRETLLSVALDGELSAQEQAEFSREIASDESFAREFEELQLLRSELRSSLSSLRNQKVSPDVTARIFAAVAASEGTADTSPQVAPATVSEVSGQSHRSNTMKRVAAVFALAASLLLAVSLWNRSDEVAPIRNSIAMLPDAPSLPKPSDVAIPSTANQTVEPESVDSALMVASEPTATFIQSDSDKLGSTPKVMGIKPSPTSEMASATESMAESPAQQKVSSAVASDRVPLNVVLVLSVELTDLGRDQHALQEALRATDIRLGNDSIMDDNVVSHLRDSKVIDTTATDGAKAANLFFVEASAKRVDRFMSYLMSSPELFASVGLSLAMEPPLLASVGELREIDPTKIRQNVSSGSAFGIVSSDRRSLSIAPDYPFMPVTSSGIASGLLNAGQEPVANTGINSSANAVDDFPSQVLLLVK